MHAPGRRPTPNFRGDTALPHTPGEFLRAALPLGLQLRHLEEPAAGPGQAPTAMPDELTTGPWKDWPWSLMQLIPEATRAAWDIPAVIVLHFEFGSDDRPSDPETR